MTSDVERFAVANHDLVTIIEQPGGWRLWCMRCGLKGEQIYEGSAEPSKLAAELRSTIGPRCSR